MKDIILKDAIISQEFDSKMTSVNSRKLPAIYNKINWDLLRNQMYPGCIPHMVDYGCGKYIEHIKQFMFEKGWLWYGYDPNWWPWPEFHDTDRYFNVILCSNVLNVIKETEIVNKIHKYLRKHSDYYFITVYSKTGMGIGHETKKGCWQRDEPLANYMYHDEVIRKQVLTSQAGQFFVI